MIRQAITAATNVQSQWLGIYFSTDHIGVINITEPTEYDFLEIFMLEFLHTPILICNNYLSIIILILFEKYPDQNILRTA